MNAVVDCEPAGIGAKDIACAKACGFICDCIWAAGFARPGPACDKEASYEDCWY